MNTACHLLLCVISSVLLSPAGSAPALSTCSALASGILYGSFSLRDLFPVVSSGCSWALENPDPTKYSLYLKFDQEEPVCTLLSPLVQPLDHYVANHSCTEPEEGEEAGMELCQPGGPVTFLHFDKNFLRLCLSSGVTPALSKDLLERRFVEILLINNDNSSQFMCAVLCRWIEECVRAGGWQQRCTITQTDCTCPHVPPHHYNATISNAILPATSSDCCVTELHSGNANDVYSKDMTFGVEFEDNQKVKTQRPRSADEPGIYMAQTGDPAAEEWSQWSMCSLTCGQGWQVRTRSCVSSLYGTLCSGPLRETRSCNNSVSCPVEGHWLEWGQWNRCSVTCSNGTQQRMRRCSVSVHGSEECKGAASDTRDCSNPECPADGKWGPWNHWSLCSKTCDTGWQRRFRMCQGTGIQGYPCEGSGEEVHTCNEKKCPAFHEMCKDEYVLSLTWKKTAAGEITYNKCPPNATGSASRRCLLDAHGVAYWGPPSFARCISHEYRYLHLALREHLAKGQRLLAGDGMSQVVRSLLDLVLQKTYYSGDLLFSVEILRNVTDTYKRATYIPSLDDVKKFFEAVSHMVDAENKEKWEDAQQVFPGSVHLMKVVEDFIHLVGDALKAFQSQLIVTENLVISIQREPVSAVSSDINFPMKGRRGMNDWVRSAEDKLFIPKEVLSLSSSELDEAAYFVIGAVLYRSLGFILPPPRNSLAVSSKVLTVTVRPLTKPAEPLILVELSHIVNGTSDAQCVTWDFSKPDSGFGNWDTQGCQTVHSHSAHTKCLCHQLSTFALLAQLPKDPVLDPSAAPSVPLMIGCAVSCMALLILLAVYAAFWRFIKSERSIILLNFCISILASNVLLLVGQSQALSKGVCTMTAAFLHFFFLSSFCWVLTEAWQSYLAVLGRMRSRLLRKRFLCLGWGLPALIVAVSVGFTRTKGYGTSHYCWLSLEGGLLYAFVGPAAVIVLVNMLIGIIIFNKLMSRDGISDKSKKQRAGSSLWSSCVVLPLLALTWMSAVLAMTDRRSILFQVLFAIFNSVQGVVILTIHGFLRREVQEVVRCQTGVCKSEESENSPDSCKNGQVQLMTDFEKDIDLTCQTTEKSSWYTAHGETVLFKGMNMCNPATIAGTLSRISLDDDEDTKLNLGSEGISFSALPGNILTAGSLRLQQPKLGQKPLKVLNEFSDPPAKKEVNLEPPGPMYLCRGNSLRSLDMGWMRTQEQSLESDYMVLPRRTLSLKPFSREEGRRNLTLQEMASIAKGQRSSEAEGYPSFLSVDHINMNMQQPYGPVKHQYSLQFKQHPVVRQVLGSEVTERSRTMPRTVPGPAHASGSLQRKRLRYSDMDFEKVMHTRKRHSELYHELNRKFHTLERYREGSRDSKRDKRWSISSGGDRGTCSEKTSPQQRAWERFRATPPDPLIPPERLELHCGGDWGQPSISMDLSDGDFQTEV
ncbi:adhesion G protein-coupled receptor B2 [Microcaecilia unicolor]|uniref:Adhesion G protein-coupled receptor B2 n=1 Tax=Microcaecilia unicolor TaxID=1415580 RepID=A0A6P7ZKW9_9AMPH|nr:adhesion G protein-coupled receptor B2 [Microcaecilia unicolor]